MNLVAIDIGNTSVYAAQFSGQKIIRRARVATADVHKPAGRKFFKALPFKSAEAIVIGSVVPAAGKFLRTSLKRVNANTLLIGKDLSVPIKKCYRRPEQVGTDRLLNALAAWRRFKTASIVIDFGTGITFDVVSPKGEYLGGVIAPGIEISLEALFQKTALLPKIRLEHPRSVIGSDTIESIRAGCSHGIGGLCDRLVEAIQKETGFKARVLATGGYARFMSRYCHSIQAIDPELTVRGILLSYLAR